MKKISGENEFESRSKLKAIKSLKAITIDNHVHCYGWLAEVHAGSVEVRVYEPMIFCRVRDVLCQSNPAWFQPLSLPLSITLSLSVALLPPLLLPFPPPRLLPVLALLLPLVLGPMPMNESLSIID